MIRYCKSLCADPDALPEDFWSNSSGNEIVRRFIDKADIQTKNEIERLISGECIEKEIVEELTYNELDKSIENLWSVLFTTGYLTQQGRTQNGKYLLSIPNTEIRNLFTKKIKEWFSDVSKNDGKTLEIFCNAFIEKKPEKIEQLFGNTALGHDDTGKDKHWNCQEREGVQTAKHGTNQIFGTNSKGRIKHRRKNRCDSKGDGYRNCDDQ